MVDFSYTFPSISYKFLRQTIQSQLVLSSNTSMYYVHCVTKCQDMSQCFKFFIIVGVKYSWSAFRIHNQKKKLNLKNEVGKYIYQREQNIASWPLYLDKWWRATFQNNLLVDQSKFASNEKKPSVLIFPEWTCKKRPWKENSVRIIVWWLKVTLLFHSSCLIIIKMRREILFFDNSIKCYEARVISGAQAGVFNYIKMTVQIDFMSILVSTLTSLDQTGGKNIFALHLLCLCNLLQILGVLLYM